MWYGLQQLQKFGVAVVRDPALLGEVMMVRRYKLADGYHA